MLEHLDRAAMQSVMRGCGFASIAIVMMMAAFTGNLPAQLKSGGFAALLMGFILILKAAVAPNQRFRKTETWLMLADAHKPPEASAQQLITNARRLAFLRAAYLACCLAAGLLGAGFFAGLMGF